MSTFNLTIVTPGGEAFAGETEYLSVMLPDGRAGFMRGALPQICVLSAGEVVVKSPWDELRFNCGNGILRISTDGVYILTSECVKANSVETQQPEKNDDGQIEYAKVKIAKAFKRGAE